MFSMLEKYWKILLFFPVAMLVFSLAILMNNQVTKGSFIERDIELTGGNMITVEIVGDVT